MNIDRTAVRDGLNARLAPLTLSAEARARIWLAVRNEKSPAPRIRRLPATALAAALAVALLGGAALAAGANLFQRFAGEDPRYGDMAEEAAVSEARPLTAEMEKLGAVGARIDSAWYDGSSLAVALALERTNRTEPYAPTEEELAEMESLSESSPRSTSLRRCSHSAVSKGD